MKKPILFLFAVVVIVLAGGAYLVFHINSKTVTPEPVVTTESTPKVVGAGERCGGNMQNAPTCSTGLHCAPEAGSHLPFGDVGGLCVADNPALYVDGNLLLGTDATTTLGKYLIAYNGMTLYTFTKDKTGTSTCSGECAVNWPPYIVAATSSLSNIQAGVTGKVGSIVRTDGSMQVTYNGKPLYFFAKDTKSGDTTGQNVGKVWFVVKP